MVRLVAFVTVLAIFTDGAFGALPGIQVPEGGQLHAALKPNERESFDDCHLRYYQLGSDGAVAPAAGRPAYLREFAHMGAIGWTQPDGTIKWSCGGSLIWENFLLTAAHCASDEDNVPPSVVRFGDLNLYNDTDDAFAQQYNIVEIIRHPEHKYSAKYHDIALIKLERNVTLNETVAPACLWDEEELRFGTLESAGWGATGVGQAQTPILLKVSLRLVEKSLCERYYRVGDRGLKQGLQDYHLCAGDPEMDTCPGDSGGPLQVKLLHNAKVTPFIVGVTSFGTFCGQSVPGVYVRVAPYIPWIRSVLAQHDASFLEWQLKPYACAVRYVKLREYEPEVVRSKSDGTESLDFRGVHISMEQIPSTVAIVWEDVEVTARMACHGVLIDEETVLTLAQCASSNGTSPSKVVVLELLERDIGRVHVHPRYAPGAVYDNIAVLQLKKPFDFNEVFKPSCPWYSPAIPNDQFEVTGVGRTDLNRLLLSDYDELEIDGQPTMLLSRTSERAAANCTLAQDHRSLFGRGLTEEHLCFGNELFLVPGACEQLRGGAIQRRVFRYSKNLDHVYALNLLGKDCGYGQGAALGVRLGSHAEWLREVLLPSRHTDDDSVQFFNTDLELRDHCKLPRGGGGGMCTDVSRCPRVQYDFATRRPVTLCSNSTIVCCPFHQVLNATQGAGSELDQCASRYGSAHNKDIHEPYNDLDDEELSPHVVMLTWQTQNETFDFCIATLITQSAALTTASCMAALDSTKVLVKLGWAITAPALWAKRILFHPRYEASTRRNDIAIVELDGAVLPSTGKVPACLWQNQTHTPFHLRQFLLADLQYLNSYPKYNTDCAAYRHYGNRSVEATQLCADLEASFYPLQSGEPSFWQERLGENGSVVHYLVGIVSYVFPGMTVQTRVESYVDWIKSNL